ncbi:flavonol synthase [Cladophialophora carrionii]|uniref:Flavonol synthase n=1 Tax=Cladophialophora carrionii TaxID=86049 RepID=A0A1C1CXD0_9EURO|nr:flavonol synthase [Cladophialophora carrionii]
MGAPAITDGASYQNIPETTAKLEWADLVTLDLSDFDRPGGKQRLAAQLHDAIQKIGFFYLVNFGLSQEEVNDQFSLAAKIFQLPEQEKQKYERNHSLPGGPLGFQLRGNGPGQRENVELYDDPKWNSYFEDRPRPPPCVEYKEKTEKFCRHLHYHILYRLLVLTAIILKLDDEEALWKLHDYEAMSNCHMRYMLQHPSASKGEKGPVTETIRGHTDFGTFTLLFRQPIAGLQIRTADNSWKWVKPYPASITVNVADTLSALTGGLLKSSIHRVIPPPDDQKGLARLGVIYFSRPGA